MQVFHTTRIHTLVVLALIGGAVQLTAQARLSQADATRFAGKLTQIEKNSTTPPKGNATRSTTVSDAEVNSYLKFLAGAQVPEEAGHHREPLARDRPQKVLVGRVLRARRIGMGNPHRG